MYIYIISILFSTRRCSCNKPIVCGSDTDGKGSFCNNFKVFPDIKEDFVFWCQNLAIEDIEIKWNKHFTALRHCKMLVSTLHFFPCDRENNGQIRNVTNKEMGKHTSIIGKSLTKGLPCPAATLKDVQNDFRIIATKISINSEVLSSTNDNISRIKRHLDRNTDRQQTTSDNKENEVEGNINLNNSNNFDGNINLDSNKKKFKRNNRFNSKPYSFIGNVSNTINAFSTIDEHARNCNGHFIHRSRDNTHYHGLCVEMQFNCSLGQNCNHWKDGIFIYHSQTPVRTVDFLKSHGIKDEDMPIHFPVIEYQANFCHAVAESVNSVMPNAGTIYLSLFQLKCRSPNTISYYRTHIVHNIIDLMDKVEDKRIAEIYGGVLTSEGVVIAADGAHSCTRKATHSIVSFAVAGCEMMGHVAISSTGSAASREDILLKQGLKYMRDDLHYNIVGGTTDQSASGQKIVRNFCGEAICDIWHILKILENLIKAFLLMFTNQLKILITQFAIMIKKFKKTTITITDMKHALQVLGNELIVNNKCDDIHSQFVERGYGMAKWTEVTVRIV